VHQELRDRGVQMNTNSARNKVEEGTHFAVKRGGPNRFHRINRNGVPLYGDSLNISTGERSVDFVPQLQLGLVKGAAFPLDDEAAFSGCDALPWLRGLGVGRRFGLYRCCTSLKGVTFLAPFPGHCGPRSLGFGRQGVRKRLCTRASRRARGLGVREGKWYGGRYIGARLRRLQ